MCVSPGLSPVLRTPLPGLLFVSASVDAFFRLAVSKRSPSLIARVLLFPWTETLAGDRPMRALIVCAIVITAAIGLSGCFHHAETVTQQPLKLG